MVSCSLGLVTILWLAVSGRSAPQLPMAVRSLSDQVFPLRNGRVEVLICEFRNAINILWDVNSTKLINQNRVFPFNRTNAKEVGNGIVRSSISFPLVAIVNNTRIECIAFGEGYRTNTSSTAILTIADVPLSPVPHLSMLDLHNHNVTWDAPFSSPHFPILSYNLSVVLSNGYSNFVVITGDVQSQSHNLALDYSLSSCTNMTISLTAQNEVGYSQPGVALQNLPAAPGEFVEKFNASVTFSKEDIPHIQVDFIFPRLCKNNDATYFLQFLNEKGLVVYTATEVVPWTQGSRKTSIHVTNTAIKKDSRYEANLYISTMGGNITDTFEIDTSRGSQDSTGLDLYSSEQDLNGSNAGLKPKHPSNHNFYIIVGVAGGFAILLVIILIIIVIAILYWRRKLKSRKRVCSENVLKKMIHNPVYDNQIEVIYDEIPSDNDKYLQSLPQGQEENDEGYTSVRSTPVQVTAIPDMKPENQDPDDPYTVMNSIGTVLPRLSLTDDNETDHPELSRTASRSKRHENQYHFK